MKPSPIFWKVEHLRTFVLSNCAKCIWHKPAQDMAQVNDSCVHPCSEPTMVEGEDEPYRWPVALAAQITQDGIDYTDDGNPFCHWFTPKTQEES